jgi:hypothetical protein
MEEVSARLQRSVDKDKQEVQKISAVERGHIHKFVVEQIKMVDRLGHLTKRFEKYTGWFRNSKHALSMSMDQYKFP